VATGQQKPHKSKLEFQGKLMCGWVCYLNNFIAEFITDFVGIPCWPMWQIKGIWFLRHCLHLLPCNSPRNSPILGHLHLPVSFWPGAQARVKMAQNKQILNDSRPPNDSIPFSPSASEPREAAKIESFCNRYLARHSEFLLFPSIE